MVTSRRVSVGSRCFLRVPYLPSLRSFNLNDKLSDNLDLLYPKQKKLRMLMSYTKLLILKRRYNSWVYSSD